MTLKQAIKQTLKKHEQKVNNYLEGTDNDIGDCSFCIEYSCFECPIFKAEGKYCYNVFPIPIYEDFIENDNELCNVLARMMHLHVFEDEYNAVMKERGESN